MNATDILKLYLDRPTDTQQDFHPEVVKVLGGAALAIALGRVATRMRR